jgi:hypothetical protein
MEMIRKAAAVEVLAATTSDYLHATPNTPPAGSSWTRAFFVEDDETT